MECSRNWSDGNAFHTRHQGVELMRWLEAVCMWMSVSRKECDGFAVFSSHFLDEDH